MSLPTASSKIPQCSNCFRRFFALAFDNWVGSSRQQVRGKKKLARPTSSIKVRLLQDVPRFGRQGAIIPVAAGRMRNDWYPRRMAEYMTEARLDGKKLRDIQVDRDFNFGVVQQEKSAQEDEETEQDNVINVRVKVPTPQRSREIISALLPTKLEFYRQPIAVPLHDQPRPQSTTRSSQRAINSAAADLAAASEPLLKSESVGIYGSLSTMDIAASIKAILAESEEGSRVVLSSEDISFVRDDKVDEGVEVDRVKHLGEFEIEIRPKGALEVVKRAVTIIAQE
ncbi:MAG: hypothetical protein M1827_002739 [Pycnora praestabilis]|nr:MAG: hypothetical protein M1827_002739 [Pycnora praestabilis]